MKTITLALAFSLFISKFSYGAESAEKVIHGTGNTEISMTMWNSKIRSWTSIEYRNGQGSFPIYKLLPSAPVPSLAVDTASEQISADNNFLILQRIELGVLTDDKNHPQNTEKAYCDVINISTGCVLLTRPAEYCSGSWDNGKWKTDNGKLITPTLETPRPANIISNVATLNKSGKANSIKEYMFMGVESYLACHPPHQSVQALNDLAFFLAEGGDNYNAMKLYRALEKASPTRIVLKLNIADALWVDGKTNEAKKYYTDYKTLMEKTGRSKLVPEHVRSRLSQP